MKWVVILLLLAFGLGGCFGSKTASPDVEFVKITKTKTVTAEPEPAPEPELIMPSACVDALRYARQIANAGAKMYQSGDRQLDIISQARGLLADGENTAPAEIAQRNLAGRTVNHLSNLSESLYHYDVATKECEAERP